MTTDADGWIEHDGKGMPVDGETRVWVRFRSGIEDGPSRSKAWCWNECGAGTVTHYRIVDEAKPAATATKFTEAAPSLRDQFAMAALTGLLANGPDKNGCVTIGGETVGFDVAAYILADAMMTERAK